MTNVPPRDLPNVVLIVSEDHGPHLGCYGDPNAHTPNLDRLAEEGVRFTNHHTTCAICSPGRASILTGLYPHQNGQIHLATHKYAMYRHFSNLATILKEAGLRTARLGKLHVLPEEAIPFDFVWNEPDRISFGHRDVHETATVAGRFANQEDSPFFLYACFSDAHLPMLHQSFGVPGAPLRGEDITLPGFCPVDAPHMRDRLAGYYNCLERLDTGIGLMLAELQRQTDRETIVLFTVDHGQQFIRGKLTSYEGGLRVPLIIHAPERMGTGLVRDELTSHVDILPTVLDLLGLPPLAERSGSSLAPLGRGEEPAWRQYVVGEWTGRPARWFPQRSIRNHRFKLIVNYLSGRENLGMKEYLPPGAWESSLDADDVAALPTDLQSALERAVLPPPEEIYDLQEDPFELNNLAGEAVLDSVRTELRQALTEWQTEHGDRIADPTVLDALTRMHAENEQRHYPDGTFSRGNVEKMTWAYAEVLDPGVRI